MNIRRESGGGRRAAGRFAVLAAVAGLLAGCSTQMGLSASNITESAILPPAGPVHGEPAGVAVPLGAACMNYQPAAAGQWVDDDATNRMFEVFCESAARRMLEQHQLVRADDAAAAREALVLVMELRQTRLDNPASAAASVGVAITYRVFTCPAGAAAGLRAAVRAKLPGRLPPALAEGGGAERMKPVLAFTLESTGAAAKAEEAAWAPHRGGLALFRAVRANFERFVARWPETAQAIRAQLGRAELSAG
jgi:hypothetical protein